MLIAFVAATHDIAIDGYYLEALDRKGQARFVGYRVMAYRLALISGAGGIIALSHFLGWLAAMGTAALVLFLLLLYHALFLPTAEKETLPVRRLLSERGGRRVAGIGLAGFLLAVLLYRSRHWPPLGRFLAPLARMGEILSPAAWISLTLFAALLVLLALRHRIRERFLESDSFYANAFLTFLDQKRIGWALAFIVLPIATSLALFFLASPRIGLISFLLVIVFIFIKLNLSLIRRLVAFISHSRLFKNLPSRAPLRVSATILITLLLLVGYVLLLIGVIFFASRYDYRMELLVTDPPTWLEIKGFLTLDETVLLSLAHRLVFLERMVYWFTGWHIFNDYPWLGVGLGNAGFFAIKQTPAIGWASYEVRSILFYWPQLPNTKNFWVRLLAETGLVGFSVFFAWLVTLFNSARLTLKSNKSRLVIFAFMGQLSLIALLGEGFSIDSFAMPYYWVAAGLIAIIAAYHLVDALPLGSRIQGQQVFGTGNHNQDTQRQICLQRNSRGRQLDKADNGGARVQR